jgi:hypothetical protein
VVVVKLELREGLEQDGFAIVREQPIERRQSMAWGKSNLSNSERSDGTDASRKPIDQCDR